MITIYTLGDTMKQHEITRQIEYIQRLLSQGKKPIGFFIGAGCPLSILLPTVGGPDIQPLIADIKNLTTTIDLEIKGDSDLKASWTGLNQTLIDDGYLNPTIEDILTKIRSLKSVAGTGTVRGLNFEELSKLEERVCTIISKQVDKSLPDGLETPYHNFAIWCRSLEREYPISVFTTNYDLLLEQAFEECAVPYFDGFVGSRLAFFDLRAVEDDFSLPARWTRLWKIHGSINWRLTSANNVVRSTVEDACSNYLIFPSHLKYDQSRKMPYLAMLDRLQNFILKKSSILFICGYSFGDEHINDVINRCLQGNATAMAFALMYGNVSDETYAQAKQCASRTPNLSLLGFDGAIIGRQFAGWDFGRVDDSPHCSSAVSRDAEGNISGLSIGDFKNFSNMMCAISEFNQNAE